MVSRQRIQAISIDFTLKSRSLKIMQGKCNKHTFCACLHIQAILACVSYNDYAEASNSSTVQIQ